MPKENEGRAKSVPPCRDVASDDGIDPRYYFRPSRKASGQDRKTLQLCAQIGRAVQLALTGICTDPILQSLLVVGVDPAPDAQRVRVRLTSHDADTPLKLAQQRLDGAAVHLRTAVAKAIHRKRVPLVLLQVVVAEERV